ncbi:TMEM175 family protein [Flammeovirga sp. OC4]|uniref:TMEM175 family protein n=1 Tax=Flammeovirga sp. OC4 TaxID=1382345 RepID=UPI0005C65547|nr:TMEM175 family protein [Flammeovirga sp. OC4]
MRANSQKLRDYSYFLDYVKHLGMLLFAISMTTPILGLVVFDVETEIVEGDKVIDSQLIWDKPFLPYVAGFVILVIHWFKFVEVHHSMKNIDFNQVLITFGFFFLLCLYPYFEMNIEFTSDQPHSRAIFSAVWGLLGIFSFWKLHHAKNNGMLKDELSDERIKVLSNEILADPVVALVCVGLSYVSFTAWLVGMVVLVPIANYILTRISIKAGF